MRPFASEAACADAADRVWTSLFPTDWVEAFRAHPRIGDRQVPGREDEEQEGMRQASEAVRRALDEANRLYEKRFGYICVVCASGRSAQEMLDLCRLRLHNDPEMELAVAGQEQRKITRLRLAKLLTP